MSSVMGKGDTEPGKSKIVALAPRLEVRREMPPTDEEVREYRAVKERLMRMLLEWEKVRNQCPLAKKILSEDG